MINTVAARATVVMPGLAEGRLLTGANEPDDIAQFYLQHGVHDVVIKLGAAGARGWTADGETARSRSFTVTPIDTVGAGDGFAAGYLAALLAGAGLQQRLDQGRRRRCPGHHPPRRPDRYADPRRGRRLDDPQSRGSPMISATTATAATRGRTRHTRSGHADCRCGDHRLRYGRRHPGLGAEGHRLGRADRRARPVPAQGAGEQPA